MGLHVASPQCTSDLPVQESSKIQTLSFLEVYINLTAILCRKYGVKSTDCERIFVRLYQECLLCAKQDIYGLEIYRIRQQNATLLNIFKGIQWFVVQFLAGLHRDISNESSRIKRLLVV